ncbi:MAG TPA: hypothetical protein VHA78_03180 [Candidatus Peribacteraceae bacterium]|nr:hypothetical protein [Candidatus Peribacteraceae bacterium]
MPKNIVFEGNVQPRPFTNGFLTQSKMTQALCWAEGGSLLTGFVVLNDDKTEAEGMLLTTVLHDTLPRDIISGYRQFRFFEALPRVDTEIVRDVMSVCIRTSLDALDGHADTVQRMQDLLGAPLYAELIRAVPPDLSAMLETLSDFGVNVDKDAITRAALRGEIEFTKELEEFGIETPKVRRKRLEERDAVVQQVRPHFQAFLEAQGLCNCVECLASLCVNATIMHDHGVEDEMLVGLSLWCFLDRKDASVRLISILLSIDPPSTEANLSKVASFLTERFPGKNKRQYRRALETAREKLMSLA